MPITERHLGGIFLKEWETLADRDRIISEASQEIDRLYEAWQREPSRDIELVSKL